MFALNVPIRGTPMLIAVASMLLSKLLSCINRHFVSNFVNVEIPALNWSMLTPNGAATLPNTCLSAGLTTKLLAALTIP